MNKSHLLLLALLISGLAAAPALARHGNAGRGNGSADRSANSQRPAVCDGSGPHRGDPAYCDGSGPGQGTPRRDGFGKSATGRGNPNSTGTPLKDGSGRTTARGHGPKDGTGNNADCPNASGS